MTGVPDSDIIYKVTVCNSFIFQLNDNFVVVDYILISLVFISLGLYIYFSRVFLLFFFYLKIEMCESELVK